MNEGLRGVNAHGRVVQKCRVCGVTYLLAGFAAHAAAEKRRYGDDVYRLKKILDSQPIQEDLKIYAKKIIQKNNKDLREYE